MSTKKHHGKLKTDLETDYLYDYFMNEDKFNEQLKGQWDEELTKKFENHEPKLDSRIITDGKLSPKFTSSSQEEELPSNHSEPNYKRADVDFNDEESDYNDRSISESSQSSVRSPFQQKIAAAPTNYPQYQSKHSDTKNYHGDKSHYVANDRQLLGENLIEDIPKYIETAEERRARARDAYSNLQDLVDKYKIKLNKPYSIDSDPDEMEAEYKMHKDRRNKNNQVKFYKQIMLNIVCGAEFINEKYNPFEFKLKDWSKHMASDMDDYTEVLEEIYEKYKDKGGKMAPEVKLLFMIIMSGVTFHLSQALFGSSGITDAVQNNPNILNKLLGGLMKGGVLGGNKNESEPAEAKETSTNNKNLLNSIRQMNKNKNSDVKSDIKSESQITTTEGRSESSDKISATTEALALERERRVLAEQRANFEAQLRKQNEMYNAQLEELRNKTNTPSQHVLNTIQTVPKEVQNMQFTQPNNNYSTGPINQILSDASKKPRFQENPLITGTSTKSEQNNSDFPRSGIFNNGINLDDQFDIFDSEIKDTIRPTNRSTKRTSATKKPSKQNFDELLETLEESTDIDIDDIIETSNKKKTKPIMSTRKPKNNSATRSVSKRNKTDSATNSASNKRNNKVINL